jgi:hypothetical protein
MLPVTNVPDYHSVVAKRLLAIATCREMGDSKKAREMMISLIFYARGCRNAEKPNKREYMNMRDMDELEFTMANELRQAGLTPRQETTGGTLMEKIRSDRLRVV